MQTKTTFKFLSATFISVMLVACGGADPAANNRNASSAFASTNANSSTQPVDAITLANIGYGSGANFQAGKIGVGIDTGLLSPGGTTTLTVNLVSGTGTLITQDISVTFNSKCFAAQKALLSSTSVSTTNGEASTTYTANGCVGEDLITATVSNNNKVFTAQATINVEQDTIGSVRFSDATPQQINLKGTGGAETSVVRFQVFGSTGAPIGDIPVNFVLSTTTGGLLLTNATGKTNSAGYASTTVQAGTAATSVRITATTSTGLSTQSNVLSVSTGIPDQNSMSLSLTDLAPISWEYDGVESTANIRLADAFNNLVPDGTAINFTTSGGAIDPSCVTKGGVCTVKWRSQVPRPTSNIPFTVSSDLRIVCPNAPAECRSGRVKILATAIGNESFIDKNGNGLYDGRIIDGFTSSDRSLEGEKKCAPNVPLSSAQIGETLSCDDLGEAYVDKNFNGARDLNEEIIDFNTNLSFNSGDGIYNGVLCNADLAECNTDSVHVRDDILLVMASTSIYAPAGKLPGQPSGKVSIPAGGSELISMLLADRNGNGMPAGTTIKVSTDTASNITAKVTPSTALGMTQEPTIMGLFLKAGDDISKKPSGTVVIEITAPSILGNVHSYMNVSVCGPETPATTNPTTNAVTPATLSNCGL